MGRLLFGSALRGPPHRGDSGLLRNRQALGQIVDQDEVDADVEERDEDLFARVGGTEEVHRQTRTLGPLGERRLHGSSEVMKLDDARAHPDGVIDVAQPGPLSGQTADPHVAAHLPGRSSRFVPTGQEHLIETFLLDDSSRHLRSDGLPPLDLKIDPYVPRQDRQGFAQGRDGLSPACIESPQLPETMLRDLAPSVRRAVDRGIVDDDDLAVSSAPEIELDLMSTEIHGIPECGQGVLRRMERTAAMRGHATPGQDGLPENPVARRNDRFGVCAEHPGSLSLRLARLEADPHLWSMSRASGSSQQRDARLSEVTPVHDPDLVARARSHPERGPRILFLNGGSALRDVSRVLTRYTHASIHLTTPFDSGGSSASLREAFGMPSVGDLRNRLLVLADDGSPEAAVAQDCFGHRFQGSASPADLESELGRMIAGTEPRIAVLREPQQAFARETLRIFAERRPRDFDLRRASVGNLVLTGAYLTNRDIEDALARFGRVLGVRGTVLPTTDANLHLAARLTDGTWVVGQHRLTGKEHPALPARIEEIQLVSGLAGGERVRPPASPAALARIREADLICLPMGSFYSSILCNLLPVGIGRAIADAACPKVYVPSTGPDPELIGVDPGRSACLLVEAMRADAGAETPTERLLDRVLLDPRSDRYDAPPDFALLDRLGIEHTQTPLVTRKGDERVDPQRLAEVLVTLAEQQRASPGASGLGEPTTREKED